MKTFCIGDIHGQFEALKEVLVLSKFNYDKDKLIVLGDIVDGGYNTYLVVEELLKIKNLVFCLGNHDEFFINHISSGWADKLWINQGGANTIISYGGEAIPGEDLQDDFFIDTKNVRIPVTHQDFFNKAKFYHIENEMLFVHGGINPKIPIMESQSKFDLLWDRDLIEYCRRGRIVPNFKKIFVGHTSTQKYGNDPNVIYCMAPIKFGQLIMMDCGAGWNGRLSIMNVNTEKYYISEQQNQVR